MEKVLDQRQQTRAMWAAGDFDAVAELIWEVGGGIVRRVGVGAGDDVLDVACGTGNAAIAAAEAGARVTGLDLTPELFVRGRERAAKAGVEIEWVEGDAESLPFPDESFDVVHSTFGCMFAPRQDAVAREIARVLRPGGHIGICSWTSEGTVGEFFRTVSAHLPPPPAPIGSPIAWGDEDHVRHLFAGSGIALEFERDDVVFRFDSGERYAAFYEEKFGPILVARRALEPDGRWEALRNDLIAMYERHDSGDGVPGEYLVVTGGKGS
jgi:SAM-dependent methyltransferase